MAQTRDLPPEPAYKDLPPWAHDFDNVRVRAVNAAWNALLTQDFSEISFRDLSKHTGATTQALYHHFPTLADLGANLATASLTKLRMEVHEEARRRKKPMDAFRAFFEFARLRPHHFSLALSPRFRADKEVAKRRGYIDEDLFVLATAWLDRRPSRRERELLRVLLYGGGLAVATGTTTVGAAMAAVNSALESWAR